MSWVSDRTSSSVKSSAHQRCILTVDVEDWFHILDLSSTPDLSDWANLPSRVESNLQRLLDIFSEAGVQVTCFFLGWVAERFPHLVREAVSRGHEIASHGYSHQLAYRLSRRDFGQDVYRTRLLLQDLSGTPVLGYRSAGFSATADVPWFFDELAAAGYEYDSSVFPAQRGHGGNPDSPLAPYLVRGGGLTEIPVTVASMGPARLCLFGGGYLRLFPYFLIRHMSRQVLDENRPVIFYVHPREIDPDHPRLRMGWKRRFKSYVNLHTTERKLRCILRDFPVTTIRTYLVEAGLCSAMQPATPIC